MICLRDLLGKVNYQVLQGDSGIEITSVEYDSRRLGPGSVFVCISGFKDDGHNFIPQALKAGAVALVVEKAVEVPPDVVVVKVDNARRALPVMAANFYGNPSQDLRVVGVTGTNGKTTTTHLIKAILEEAGHKVGLLGTLYFSWLNRQEKLANTTPESLEIERFMAEVRDEGGEYMVMEVSSHALDLDRVREIDFDAAILTNLTQDHLDYHGTFENYRVAKASLFANLAAAKNHYAIFNGDAEADFLMKNTRTQIITYGIQSMAQVRAVDIRIKAVGSSFRVIHQEGETELHIRLAGLFNVYNTLAAIALALQEGISGEVIKRALEKVQGVPGRFEAIDEGQDYSVIVDYAHTPDGLENILKTARQIANRRIITVFGCGGDRDRTKRPLMGGIAAQYSDFSIITSDNPRSEEPLAIINEIVVGVDQVPGARYAVIPDRREAIHHAIHLAARGDIVIIAGKGHEDYQIIKGRTYPFDDRAIARELIRDRLESEY